jgi:hypothetical protein
MKRCLEILNQAVKTLPKGKQKDQAKAALDYMSRTFEGEPQPGRGAGCPPGAFLIPT